MNWLKYLLEANIYLAIFYLLYYLLLANETHYRLNRIYLLATCVIAYSIPFFQVGVLKPAIDGAATMATIIIKPAAGTTATVTSFLNWQGLLISGYITGALVTLVIFMIKIARLVRMMTADQQLLNDRYKLVRLENSNTAFSFFNYVFIGTNVAGAETVIRHELVHIRQKHSADIIFLELIKAISWFNPFIYLLQRSLKSVHEYIADEQAAAFESDTLAYSSLLVSNAYGLGGSSITHSFFNYNLLKKRIIMLNQKRSGKLARLKYLAALPVCAGLLCASTLGFSKTYGVVDIAPQKQTDTTKKLNIVEVKQPTERSKKIRQNVDLVVREDIVKQKKLAIKETPTADKVKEIEIVPDKSSGKSADLIKKRPEIEINDKGDVYAQGKPADRVKANGKEVKADVYIVKDQSADLQSQKIPPPPPPAIPLHGPFEAFSRYIAKYTRYPAVARDNNVIGNIIVSFDITGDHKIGNTAILKGIGSGCDEEVKRVVSSFPEIINTKPGAYKIVVTYSIKGIESPTTLSSEMVKDPSFAGEIVVVGYPIKK